MGRIETQIDKIYLSIAKDLLYAPIVNGTRELNNVKLQLLDIDDNIVSVRGISDTYLFGELLWYFTGRNHTDFISSFSKMWKRLSDDGVTNNSAYGFLMKHAHEFDQIEKVIELLTKDPTSRRAVINLNVPNRNVIETKDEPCTIALQFLIRNEKLHCTAMMRSNDIWFGLPYDVAFFTELQKYIADRLKVGYGVYTHFVTSLHMYERDFDKIYELVKNPVSNKIRFNRDNFHEHAEFIADLIDTAIDHEVDAKEMLLKLLDMYEIYHREEDQYERKTD